LSINQLPLLASFTQCHILHSAATSSPNIYPDGKGKKKKIPRQLLWFQTPFSLEVGTSMLRQLVHSADSRTNMGFRQKENQTRESARLNNYGTHYSGLSPHGRSCCPTTCSLNSSALFSCHANPKYFLFYLSHRIFKRMHGALNVGKKNN
jgi:hypothetical protein